MLFLPRLVGTDVIEIPRRSSIISRFLVEQIKKLYFFEELDDNQVCISCVNRGNSYQRTLRLALRFPKSEERSNTATMSEPEPKPKPKPEELETLEPKHEEDSSPKLDSENPDPEKAKEMSPSRKEKILAQAAECIKKGEEANEAAKLAREHAERTSDPKEKQKALEEAVKEEKIAKGAFKAAGRLQSGVWQGGAAGAGIGAGIGTGVGTVVGSIVGGVTSIPTTGLGLLVGTAAGAAHGPWFKIGNGEVKEGKDCTTEEIENAEEVEVKE